MSKPVVFVGNSRRDLKDFPRAAMREAGFQLGLVEQGLDPNDFKPMPTVGAGAFEIRIWDEAGAFRVVYVAKFEEAVYVLHAFHKTSQQTEQSDIELAARRYREIVRSR